MTASSSLAWVPSHVPAAGRLFLALAGRLRHGVLHLVTPDGDVQIGDAASPLVADLRITDWRACGRILRSGDVGFAEAYRDGWIDSANLTNLLRLAIVNAAMLDQAIFGNALARSVLRLRHLLRRNSRRVQRGAGKQPLKWIRYLLCQRVRISSLRDVAAREILLR